MKIIANGSFSALVKCDDKYIISISKDDAGKLWYYKQISSGRFVRAWTPKVKKVENNAVYELICSSNKFRNTVTRVEALFEIEVLTDLPPNLNYVRKFMRERNGSGSAKSRVCRALDKIGEMVYDVNDAIREYVAPDIGAFYDTNGRYVDDTTPDYKINPAHNILWRGNQFVFADPFCTYRG